MKKWLTQEFDEKKAKEELLIDARATGIPSGAAEVFVKKAMKDAKKTLEGKKMITEKDWKRAAVRELKKYNADFAYIYENRDKII